LLDQVLDEFDRLSRVEGMRSLSMRDVAATVARTDTSGTAPTV
jgi:hypothetical protein